MRRSDYSYHPDRPFGATAQFADLEPADRHTSVAYGRVCHSIRICVAAPEPRVHAGLRRNRSHRKHRNTANFSTRESFTLTTAMAFAMTEAR